MDKPLNCNYFMSKSTSTSYLSTYLADWETRSRLTSGSMLPMMKSVWTGMGSTSSAEDDIWKSARGRLR